MSKKNTDCFTVVLYNMNKPQIDLCVISIFCNSNLMRSDQNLCNNGSTEFFFFAILIQFMREISNILAVGN